MGVVDRVIYYFLKFIGDDKPILTEWRDKINNLIILSVFAVETEVSLGTQNNVDAVAGIFLIIKEFKVFVLEIVEFAHGGLIRAGWKEVVINQHGA
jgi:hypothetical protein